MKTEVTISLGANLGNRLQNLKDAKKLFLENLSIDHWIQSSIYETSPVDCEAGAQNYYNCVIGFEYKGSPKELLDECLSIEIALGRETKSTPGQQYLSRTLDADILYFGDQLIETQNLTVPHPRLISRRFVLEPLAEIRPDYQLIGQSLTIQELLNTLESEEPPLTLMKKNW